MPKNILQMIDGLKQKGEEATTEDLWGVVAEMEKNQDEYRQKKDAEVEALNKTLQDILQASTKEPDPQEEPVAERASKVFRAARKGDMDSVYKYGGAFVKNDNPVESGWSPEEWVIKGAEEKAALGSYYLRGDAVTGSYLVPSEYASEVMRVAQQSSVMMPRVRRVPMTARTLYYPAESTMLSLTWVSDETTAKTEGQYVFAQKSLSAETAACYVGVTDELIEDSVINLADYFRDIFAEAWGKAADTQILNSNASPFTSMLYNSSCNIRNMDSGKTSLSDVDFEDLINMENDISTAAGENALNGAVWIMSRKVFNYLRLKKDDNGNPIYQRPAEGQPATIYNHPYILSDVMPTADATDTPFLILGNPRYWIMGERTAMEFRIFRETSYSLLQDQVFFRFRIRAAFVGGVPSAFAVLETAAS